jgi:Tol biopolymer transport system component
MSDSTASRRVRLPSLILVLLAVGSLVVIAIIAAVNVARLTGTPAATVTPVPPEAVLSPDDTRQIGFMTNRDGNWELYEMTLGTRAENNLTDNPADDGFGAYSNDRGAMTFISTRDRATEDGELTAYMMDADGSNQRRVLSDLGTIMSLVTTGRFDWDFRRSASGGTTLISLRDLNLEVYLRSTGADGEPTETNLSRSGAIDWFGALNADGTQVAFAGDRDGNQEIYLIGADGENLRRLTDAEGYDVYPVWASDMRQLVFYSESAGQLDGGALVLSVVDTQAGTPETRLLEGAPLSLDGEARPLTAASVFSPDGSAEIFMGWDEAGGDWEIFYQDVGGVAVNLTDNDADDIFPAWK